MSSAAHAHRVPHIDLQSLLAAPSPHIDLRLEAYEQSTRNFLKAVANYKSRAINSISERRALQAAERKKTLEKCQAVEAETNKCKLRELELVSGWFSDQLTARMLNAHQSWSGRKRKERMPNSPVPAIGDS
jgi:hypothetical protein